MTDDPHKAAAKLTKAQIRSLRYDRWPPTICDNREHPLKNALVKKGIAIFTHRAAGKGEFTLTPFGEQVRDIVREKSQ